MTTGSVWTAVHASEASVEHVRRDHGECLDGGSRERSEREPRSDANEVSVRTAFDASGSERSAPFEFPPDVG